MENIIDIINEVLNCIYNLSAEEIVIIIAVTAVLMLVMAYRWFGIKVAFVLLLVYLIIYTLYINDIFGKYQEHEESEDQHMQALEEELKKD